MAEKLRDLEDEAKLVGLKVNSGKTKLMKINTNVQNQLQVNGDDIGAVEEFTYLGSLVTRDGRVSEDVGARIRKVTAGFIQLYPMWRAREITTTNIEFSEQMSKLFFSMAVKPGKSPLISPTESKSS
jgi:hypothetical protein